MYFKVKTVAADGGVRHEIHQGDADEIRQRLSNAGNTFLSLGTDWTRWLLAPRVDTGERPLVFCDQLHTLLKAGISVPESLLALRDSERTLHVRHVLAQVLSEVETGQSFSSALGSHPAISSGILAAGGALALAVRSAARDRRRTTHRPCRSAGRRADRLAGCASAGNLPLAGRIGGVDQQHTGRRGGRLSCAR